jgi:hypothetical protein
MKIAGIIVLLFISAFAASAQREYCFENEGLKNVSTITFKVDGAKVEGNYKSAPYDDDSPQMPNRFTGTIAQKVMTVKFDGTIPDEFTHIKTLRWTLGTSLKVQMYGKNYNTNKWGVYAATFLICPQQMNAAVPAQVAKQLYFAKGESELSETFTLVPGGSKAYVVSGRAAQILSIDSTSKDLAISMVSGNITAPTTEPGHYDATLVAYSNCVFEVKNTSAKELTATITVVMADTHDNK